jgi:hypothetical protein
MVTLCRFGSDEGLSGCTDAGVRGFDDMTAIAISGAHAYITHLTATAAAVIHCDIGTDGLLSGCADAGVADLRNAYGLVASGSTLYVSNSRSPLVRKCEIREDGSLAPCSNAGLPDGLAAAAEDIRLAML